MINDNLFIPRISVNLWYKNVSIASATAKLRKYKSPGSDQILEEVIQTGGETLCPEIYKLINCIWNEKELPDKRKESIIVPIYKKGDKLIAVTIIRYQCYQRFLIAWGEVKLRSLGMLITIWPIVPAQDDKWWWVWSSQ
jgi:hypothetical protein